MSKDEKTESTLRAAQCELEREKSVEFTVSDATSMHPFLKTGDSLTIVDKSPRVGDLLLFKLSHRIVIHRVIARKKGVLYSKGDNNQIADPLVDKSQIIGVAISISSNKFLSLQSLHQRAVGVALASVSRIESLINRSLKKHAVISVQLKWVLTSSRYALSCLARKELLGSKKS
jgi:signal peptidase I